MQIHICWSPPPLERVSCLRKLVATGEAEEQVRKGGVYKMGSLPEAVTCLPHISPWMSTLVGYRGPNEPQGTIYCMIFWFGMWWAHSEHVPNVENCWHICEREPLLHFSTGWKPVGWIARCRVGGIGPILLVGPGILVQLTFWYTWANAISGLRYFGTVPTKLSWWDFERCNSNR